MAFLAPCRSCLECLPIFRVSSPPSTPRLPAPSEPAPKPSPSPDPAELPQSSTVPELPQSSAVGLSQEQDLPFFDQNEESRPVHASLHGETDFPIPAPAEIEEKFLPEILVAAPVFSSQSGDSLPQEDGDYGRKPPAASEPSMHVPFINDISFSTTGLLHLPIPLTPAPFGTGYGYPAGQCPPQIFPPEQNEPRKDEASSENKDSSSQGEQADSAGHVHSQNGHDELIYHDHGQEVVSPHGDGGPDEILSQKPSANMDDSDGLETSISTPAFLGIENSISTPDFLVSPHGDGIPDESLSQKTSVDMDDSDGLVTSISTPAFLGSETSISTPAFLVSPLEDCSPDENLSQKPSANMDDSDSLETSISTPAFLDTEIEKKVENDDESAAMKGDSTAIDTYHSEPIALPEVAEDDGYIAEEGIGHKISHLGRHHRRDHFKQQFKGISQQIKQGGLHLRDEGGKHLQTVMTNINKQAQEFEQSGRFLIPRLNNS